MPPLPTVSALPGHDGSALHFQHWMPTGTADPQAGMLIVHGIGEHSDRYPHLVEHLVRHGIAAAGWDHRGHGRSEGPRGHVDDWSEYTTDAGLALEALRALLPDGTPLFVYAHSMGSMIALDAVHRQEMSPDGLLISGVPLQPAGVAKPHLVLLCRALSRVFPRLSIALPLSPEGLLSDPGELERLSEDPLAHRRVTLSWGREALEVVDRLHRDIPEKLHLPLKILHGQQDPVNQVEGGRWLHQHAPSPDKTLSIYPQTRHEPHNDVERDRVLEDILQWVRQRIPHS